MPAYYNIKTDKVVGKIEVNPTFDFVGVKKERVLECLKDNNIDYRIVREGENSFPITADLKDNRINLEIDDNIVTKAYYG